MSLANTPVTKSLLLGLVAGAITVSLLDIKHYFYILIDLHLWRYRQFWRLLGYQLCYNNSTEVLFAGISFYNLRNVEHLWGSRKYASFLFTCAVLTAVIPPFALILLRPVFGNLFNYMPAGPTPILFAVLAQYHAMVPHMYKYRVTTSAASPGNINDYSGRDLSPGVTLSDKSYRYVIAVHLALLQWPGSVLGAVAGWAVGYSWREGLLPVGLIGWRVPGWLVGVRPHRRSAEFEGLRRRLEGEDAAGGGVSTGVRRQSEGQAERRRNMGQQVVDQFREVL